MKSNLHRGRLVPPTSLTSGLLRQKQLAYEITRIETQLADPARTSLEWRASASRALRNFQLELRLLTEWISVRKDNAERLLREAFEVLKVLEDQVDFEPHETLLLDELDDYFSQGETETQNSATAS